MSENESKVIGFRKDYKRMYIELKQYTTDYGSLNAIDCTMCELPFHCFSAEEVDHERAVFKNVKEKYYALMSALHDAAGLKD